MNRTSQNYLSADVAEFMAGVEPTRRAGDGHIVIDLMQGITGHTPKMCVWGGAA